MLCGMSKDGIVYILMRSGYLPISIKYENRRAYYDAFTSYHKNSNHVTMLGIFAEREHKRLLEYLSAFGWSHPAGSGDGRGGARQGGACASWRDS